MRNRAMKYLIRLVVIITITTIVAILLNNIGIDKENTLMLFIIGVLVVAYSTNGYHYSIIASLMSILIFTYFFAEPVHTFTIDSQNDVILIIFFLIASLISSNLAVRFQKQLQVAQKKEHIARVLYKMSEKLFNVNGKENIIIQGLAYIEESTGYQGDFISSTQGKTEVVDLEERANRQDNMEFVVMGINKQLGVLRINNQGDEWSADQELLIKMVANQIGIALDREMIYTEQEKIKLAMEKEHMRSSLLRSISHDLRTPLTGIVGASSLILQAKDKLDYKSICSLVKDINEQGEWLIRLVENILNMTKIDNGNLMMNKQLEVIDDLINDATTHVMGLREKREYSVSMPKDVMLVEMDGKMMVQVLINLLDNAMKHTKEGDKIGLKIFEEGEKCTFQVEDSGNGIEPSIIESLFDEFVTYRMATSDGNKGIGLGLAICKAIVVAHGGEIRAENRPEGGARFTFSIPTRGETAYE